MKPSLHLEERSGLGRLAGATKWLNQQQARGLTNVAKDSIDLDRFQISDLPMRERTHPRFRYFQNSDKHLREPRLDNARGCHQNRC